MLKIFLTLFAIFLLLIVNELLWKLKIVRGEGSRKIVHILTGIFIAFWPVWLSPNEIVGLSGLMLVVVIGSRWLHVFRGIHAVKRKTIGDIIYPVTIGLVALLAESQAVFTAVILHLSLADGLAALVGHRYGKTNSYRAFGEIKSLAGTTACLCASALILLGVLYLGNQFSLAVWPVLIWVPLLVALLENVSPYGIDNLLMPMVVMLVLNSL